MYGYSPYCPHCHKGDYEINQHGHKYPCGTSVTTGSGVPGNCHLVQSRACLEAEATRLADDRHELIHQIKQIAEMQRQHVECVNQWGDDNINSFESRKCVNQRINDAIRAVKQIEAEPDCSQSTGQDEGDEK
jgi:hypothetical protein